MNRGDAKSTLVFYFRFVYEKLGVPFDSDNVVEIEGVVDDICDAAVLEAINHRGRADK